MDHIPLFRVTSPNGNNEEVDDTLTRPSSSLDEPMHDDDEHSETGTVCPAAEIDDESPEADENDDPKGTSAEVTGSASPGESDTPEMREVERETSASDASSTRQSSPSASSTNSQNEMACDPNPADNPKPSIDTENAADSGTTEPSNKRPKTASTSRSNNGSAYAYVRPNDDATERLIIKEHALESGAGFLERAKAILRYEKQKTATENPACDGLLESIAKFEGKKGDNEILVGVCGGTGVGKTSLLNACLGIDELLPSGQEEAATAVPCKVSYNYDDRKGHECLAEVIFQDMDVFVHELQLFVRLFRDRRDADSDGLYSDIREYNDMIDKGLSKFAPLFKFTDEMVDAKAEESDDVEMLKWIFSLNPEVKKLLREGTKSLQASTSDKLAKDMKKYLDSTESSRDGADDTQFALWPLISEVRVKVKSDLLRHGICLVDLPGIGDSNYSRNSVADGYIEKLHLTIVVASIMRGKDTKDTNDLLSSQQQGNMKMQGTLNSSRFAVAFTMIDNMEPARYQFRDPDDAEFYSRMNDDTAEKKVEVAQLKDDINRLQSAIGKAQQRLRRHGSQGVSSTMVKRENEDTYLTDVKEEEPDSETSNANRAIDGAYSKLESIAVQRGIAEVQTQINYQRQMHIAIMARNRYVRLCVNNDLARRQTQQSRFRTKKDDPAPNKLASQSIAEIFMTSARGFWEIENKGTPLHGLPNRTFTGIPQLRQWIRKSSASHREKYTDDLITDLRELLERFDTWSKDRAESPETSETLVTPEEIGKALQSVHDKCNQSVAAMISRACAMIDKLNPLGNQEFLCSKFVKRAPMEVDKWTRRYPDRPGDSNKMVWATYSAIIMRGGSFKSPTTQIAYDWMGKMAQPLVETLTVNWRRTADEGVEAIITSSLDDVREAWKSYPQDLLQKMADFGPILRMSQDELETITTTSAASLFTGIETTLLDLRQNLSRSHQGTIVPSLRAAFAAAFEEAQEIQGKGAIAARQELFTNEAVQNGARHFERVCNALQQKINAAKTEAKATLKKMPGRGVTNVQSTLALSLDSMRGSGDLASLVQKLVNEWSEEWMFPKLDPNHIFRQSLGIPETLIVEDLGCTHFAVTSRGVNYYDAVKNGGKNKLGTHGLPDLSAVLDSLASL